MVNKTKIWVVDDERIVRVTLSDDLKDAGYQIKEFAQAEAILIALKDSIPDIIISDLKMPGMDGIELLTQVKRIKPDIQVIVMTAYGTVENAVEAMKLGAYDYILKPFKVEEVFLRINRINELKSVKNENKRLKEQIGHTYDFSSYIGNREANKDLFHLIKTIAETDCTVLLTGETGTGKELVTNIIHYNSHRKCGPFIKVNCAVLSREIFESELFGHVKGAFTGADNDKIGRFELANGGTLFLDDIDDMPVDLQVKILRALDQREIERVGSTKPISIDVRLIASTKKNLRKLVDEGKFRIDLFYRLNVFPINLQSLCSRKKDIRYLLQFFTDKFAGKKIDIEEGVIQILENYRWPGNVRELKNIAERMVLMASNGHIDLAHIPMEIYNYNHSDVFVTVGTKTLEETLSEIEVSSIKCALTRCKNNKSKASALLGIPVTTLRSKMEKYKIE